MTTNNRTEPGVCRPLEKRYRCPSCWQRFYFKPNLDYHMQRKHGTGQQPGVCPECKGSCRTGSGYLREDCPACKGTGQQPAQPAQPDYGEVCLCHLRSCGVCRYKTDVDKATELRDCIHGLHNRLTAVERDFPEGA